MPYLMLEFESVKDAVTKNEQLSLKMIDTDSGKVVEMSGSMSQAVMKNREPTWAETQAASQTLNKEVGEKITREEYDRIKAERDAYSQQVLSGKASIETKTKKIADLKREIEELKESTLNDKAKLLIAAALDGYIEELAANQQLESYEHAKKIYKHMAGMSWVTGDDEDDDEEGDLAPFIDLHEPSSLTRLLQHRLDA